jgi:hypothetical protein
VAAVSSTVKCLWALALPISLVGLFLFLRMAAQLNEVLPPQKRIPLIELRGRFWDIKNLHEEAFPRSMLRRTSFLLMAISIALFAAAIIIGIR